MRRDSLWHWQVLAGVIVAFDNSSFSSVQRAGVGENNPAKPKRHRKERHLQSGYSISHRHPATKLPAHDSDPAVASTFRFRAIPHGSSKKSASDYPEK
jgi:hypothetical protein